MPFHILIHQVVCINLEAAEVKEPVKRQRRWNSETVQVPNIQTPNLTSSDTPKDASQPTPRRNFTRSDSTISGGSPKERIGRLS